MLFFLSLLLLLFLFGLMVFPVETDTLRPRSPRTGSYEDSMRCIEEQVQNDALEAAEYGRTIILTHGRQVERAAVLYHGYTNCPRQYEQLAQRLFEEGYNVYVPRIPHHGLPDLMTREISRLTMEELLDLCQHSADIAAGLGQRVTVLGLSMGGVMAAFQAQFREDIDCAVIIVPSFGWYFLPGVVKPLINLIRLLPNTLLWWDPIRREKRQAPYSMYYRFASKGMGDALRLGLAVLRTARTQTPKARKIVVLTNDRDQAVDEKNVRNLVSRWESRGADVTWERFSRDLHMEHDVIDPLYPYVQVDVVYDKILEAMS